MSEESFWEKDLKRERAISADYAERALVWKAQAETANALVDVERKNRGAIAGMLGLPHDASPAEVLDRLRAVLGWLAWWTNWADILRGREWSGDDDLVRSMIEAIVKHAGVE